MLPWSLELSLAARSIVSGTLATRGHGVKRSTKAALSVARRIPRDGTYIDRWAQIIQEDRRLRLSVGFKPQRPCDPDREVGARMGQEVDPPRV